ELPKAETQPAFAPASIGLISLPSVAECGELLADVVRRVSKYQIHRGVCDVLGQDLQGVAVEHGVTVATKLLRSCGQRVPPPVAPRIDARSTILWTSCILPAAGPSRKRKR